MLTSTSRGWEMARSPFLDHFLGRCFSFLYFLHFFSFLGFLFFFLKFACLLSFFVFPSKVLKGQSFFFIVLVVFLGHVTFAVLPPSFLPSLSFPLLLFFYFFEMSGKPSGYQAKKRRINPLLEDEDKDDKSVENPKETKEKTKEPSLQEQKKADEANRKITDLLIQGLLKKNPEPESGKKPQVSTKGREDSKSKKSQKDKKDGKKNKKKGEKEERKLSKAEQFEQERELKRKERSMEEVKLNKKEMKAVKDLLPTSNFLKMLPVRFSSSFLSSFSSFP